MIQNFKVKRTQNSKAIGLFDKTANFSKAAENFTKSEKLMNGIGIWAGYYRQRPDVFAEEYLGLILKPFQKILLYVMMNYNYTAFFASRGLGKSYLTALFAVIKCILYPGMLMPVYYGNIVI